MGLTSHRHTLHSGIALKPWGTGADGSVVVGSADSIGTAPVVKAGVNTLIGAALLRKGTVFVGQTLI